VSRRPGLDERRAEEIRREQQVDAEFQAHVEHLVADLVARGVPEGEARRRAWAEFGDPGRLKEESREAVDRERPARPRPALPGRWLDALRQDLRFALRQLRREPGLSLVALLTLGLGIGGTSTIVSVVQAVVLAPLPFEEPGELVVAEAVTHRGASFSVAEPAFLDWREQAPGFRGMAAWARQGGTVHTPAGPRAVRVVRASHDLPGVLGLDPTVGRPFRAEEDAPGAPAAVALLSHTSWVRDHGADPAVTGTTVELDGRVHRVVGVAPEALELLTGDAELYVPLAADPEMNREEHYLDVVARLAPGATVASVDAGLDALQAELAEIHRVDQGWTARVRDARTALLGESTIRAGWVLLGAAGLLLLMACVNVANFLLVRATARRGEMGMRTALGAGRGRLARQLFAESSVLAGLGAAAGLGVASLALPLVQRLGEARIPRLDAASLDGPALLACLASAALATLVFGAAPALQLGSAEPARALGGAGRDRRDPGGTLRSVLVGAQVAVTVVLLVGSGLLVRSFHALTSVDPGFEAENTLAVDLSMPDGTWSWEERRELLPRIREAVADLPGVRAAGATAVDPFSGGSLANFVAPEDRLPDRASEFTPVAWRVATPGFFEAMGMELRAGRGFRPGDTWGEETAVVISERLARVTWGDADPVGRRLVWNDPGGTRMTVVGVVEDLRDVELETPPEPMIYRPHEQIPWAVMTLVARVEGDPAAVAAALRSRLQELEPRLPVPAIRSLEDNLEGAVAEPRFNLALLGGFAGLGLIMAVVGVYGITAFDVRRRFREIGIRVSLGARPEAIRLMILRQRMLLAGVGALVGVGLAWGMSRWLEGLLFQVSRSDPFTWIGVLVVVAAASAAAAWFPARMATRVDPREVLSRE
jgi:predicted permease